MQEYEIYCDLDGVLVDLAGRMSEIYGEEIGKNNFVDKFYQLMEGMTSKEKLNFWSNLNKTKDCMELWKYIKQFDPVILTACSGMSTACLGKKKWCLKHLYLSPRKVICVSHSNKKQYYSGKGRILIDDLESNINEWEAKGGIGILHKNSDITLKLLKSLIYTKYDTYDI